MKFKCKYCGEEFDNPQIYMIHENSCLDNQRENGLLKEDNKEEVKEDSKKSTKK